MKGGSSSECRMLFVRRDAVENGSNDSLVSYPGIHHQVIETPARPVLVEILLDEISASAVDVFNEACGLSRLGAASNQPLNLVLVRGVDEHVKCIRVIFQKEGGATPDNDAVPLVG